MKPKHAASYNQLPKNDFFFFSPPPYITCRVLHTKSLLSSPQTLCAATTNTSTRNTNTIDSQILPKAVEYLLTPLRRLSSPLQFIPAAALASGTEAASPCGAQAERKEKLGFRRERMDPAAVSQS